MTLKARVDATVAWVMRLKPVRVFLHFGQRRGPLLSAGLSYQSIFAVFAALWVGFAVAGSIIQSRPELQRALFDFLETNVPGLIDDGSGGAVDPTTLLESVPFTLTGLIALGVLLFTATGWLGSGREAVRAMFGLPGIESNPVLLVLRDLGLALAFGAAVVLSSVVSVLSTSALGQVLRWLGIDERSSSAGIATSALAILIVLVLDTLTLGVFYRIVSGIPIPFRLLAQGTIIAAVALSVLKILGQALLGGATSNPLLASFAVIIGLLIWFNLVCQVILLGAAWIAVGAADRGLSLTGRARRTRIKPSSVGSAS